MIEPYFRVENEFVADILCFSSNSIFAFDFKEEMYWIGNTIGSESKKVPLSLPKSDFKHNKISLCSNLPLFAFVERDESSVQIYDAQADKSIRAIRLIDESRIECVSISDDGRSVLVGGKNGSLSNWNIANGKLLNIIARHRDFVLMARQSPNKRFIVSIGYDRSVIFYDKNKDKTGRHLLTATSAIKCARFFKDSSVLVLGDIEGFIYVIDTHTQITQHKFQVAYTGIVDICHYKDSYIFVLSANGLLCLCDFSTETKLMDNLSEMTYKAFVIEDNSIILSRDKITLGYHFDDFVAYGKNLLDDDNILEAYKFANIYKFLHKESFYMALEARFEADMIEAKALACGGNRAMAMKILEQYNGVPSKNDTIVNLSRQFREIDEFNRLMENGIEIRAIPMVQNNPLIAELKAYKDFEDRFLKILLLAKDLAKKGKKDDANALVMPFKKIPNKIAVIQEILLYPYEVDEALEAIAKADYRKYFRLKKEYRFVSMLDGAKELEGMAQSVYFDALKAFYAMNIKECRTNIAILKNFRKYMDFALDLEVKLDECLGILSKMRSS